MNKFEEKLSAWNFKKIAKVYLIALLAAVIGCAAAAGIVYKDRISFALQYDRVSEAAEKQDAASLQTELSKLASSSNDVVDILTLDSGNRVTWSAKSSEFSKGEFMLTRAGEEKDYLVRAQDDNAVFKYVKGDDFMLNAVFNTDFGEIRNEYRDENFFDDALSGKTVYMLSFLGERRGNNRIYIIGSPTTVAGGALTLKLIAVVGILFFMVYWVLLALWAYQNALKAKLYPLFWGIIVLLTNIAGVIVYQIYKHANATCPVCGVSQSKLHLFCTSCGAKLGETCKACGAHLEKKDVFCPGCGRKVE